MRLPPCSLSLSLSSLSSFSGLLGALVDHSRWRFDLTSGKVLADEDVCSVPCEFPIVNPAVVGKRSRYIWANVLVSEPSPLSSNGIMKYDDLQRNWVIHTFEGEAAADLYS
eukprot:SAG11_NODE_2923_length_2835_cov_1.884503_2_plen_111_part_00